MICHSHHVSDVRWTRGGHVKSGEECEKKKGEHEKWGRPGLIHHVSDIRWTRGGRENDVRERGPTCIAPMHALMRAQSQRS